MRFQFVKSRPVLTARAESGAGGSEIAGPAPHRMAETGTLGRKHALDPKGSVPRVLVVDDEPSIRLLCRVNLTAAGMDVVEAVDGNDALELARSEEPDIVLLDVMMPGIDGWKVAGELAADELTRDLPIVFLTARAERADRERGHDLGGVGYLLKPFDPVTLAALVETTLNRIDRGEREELRREMFGAP
jgi:DNA-binding response OmpR family regulator